MVSEESSSHSNNNTILQQFENHHFDTYSNSLPLNIPCLAETMSRPDMEPDPHLIDLLGSSNDTTHHQSQRLSLSLGSVPCRQRSLGSPILNPNHIGFGYDGPPMNQSWSSPYETASFAAAIGGSKYLHPAQSLLQEMLSIDGDNNNGVDKSNQRYMEKLSIHSRKGSVPLSSKLKAEISNTEILIEKHEDYVNLLKLIALLEEVERRYEEYSHHMDELVSSFEAISGLGAAKSYTALALLAMSKHFCRLRNAILAQIHVTKQKIVKDMPKISSRLSQLSLFDQESRQNRMIIQNSAQAWRPLRGLPENSVTILRAWLFEHFLHPYPNDSEKLMLASQTGLSKNQVSNWFINARVRLWKPMIEEMYKEEFEESSTESDQLLTNSYNDLGD